MLQPFDVQQTEVLFVLFDAVTVGAGTITLQCQTFKGVVFEAQLVATQVTTVVAQ